MRIISDDLIAALNIWMEARGESIEGKVGVAEVMRNRLASRRWGKTMVEVVLAPYQFSGWNTKDPNRIKALLLDDNDPTLRQCQVAWQAAVDGSNTVHGAMFYFNPKGVTSWPTWASPAKFLAQIGNHFFYRE
jgi:Cell wall hydrolyses involved in spore germination